jgi:YD repeat-containing protein
MKHFSSLLTILLSPLFIGICLAQAPSPKAPNWESPKFDRGFVMRNKIKTIEVKSYGDKAERKLINGTRYEYDANGNLTQMVETHKADTSRIHDYAYTSKGTLVSKKVTDHVWNKSYKSWYRFNRHSKLYQEKSYEVLRNNESMLLHTRQYVYDDDSVLVSIRLLENNRLARTQHYRYDERGRVVEERFDDRQGKTEKNIRYTYSDDNLLTRVTTVYPTHTTDYIYIYNNMNNPVEVQWRNDGELVGTVLYTYDEKTGVLNRMERSVNSEQEGSSVFVRVFDYDRYGDVGSD